MKRNRSAIIDNLHFPPESAKIQNIIQEARQKCPGPCQISRFRTLYWEDATDKEKYDSGYYWIQDQGSDTQYCFIPLSLQEKQEQLETIQNKIRNMYFYILEHYGKNAAEIFRTEAWADKIEKYNVIINLKYPYCQYNQGQCSMSCAFFSFSGCQLEEYQKRFIIHE